MIFSYVFILHRLHHLHLSRFSRPLYFFDDFAAVEYPLRLPVIFKNPKNSLEACPFGLVDSGAGETILHVRLAKLLGLDDIKSGKKVLYGGVGGEVEGHRHILKMRITGDSKEYQTTCAFAPIADMDCLLGQTGFFENFKVIFEKYNN